MNAKAIMLHSQVQRHPKDHAIQMEWSNFVRSLVEVEKLRRQLDT